MSAKAGAIQGAQAGVSWAGAWVAAIMLTVILALTMFALTRGTDSAGTAPASTRFVPATTNTVPVSQPIKIGSYACHQCR